MELQMNKKEQYNELRKKIDAINLLYNDLIKFVEEHELYLNYILEKDNPSNLETMSDEQIDAGWTSSNADCGYKPEDDYPFSY